MWKFLKTTAAYRLRVYSGGKANPDVGEYLVKPAGKPTSHRESTGPGKYPIPFNTRFADTKELAIMEKMIKNVTKHAFRLLNESYDGFTFWGCKDRCLTWGLSAPSTFKANQRKQWTWMMRDMIGFYIQPVGFEVLLDTGGNDPTQWRVEKIYYNNKTYDTVEELMTAYDAGSKMHFPAAKDKGLFSTYERRGDPQPKKPLRNPRVYEPDGKRYSVSGHHVEYMGWSFDFRSRTSSGIQIFDIKFKGDRIVYELSVQEAEAFYSGWSPKPLFTNYLDAAWNMGSMTFELLRGVDCPDTATFFDVLHFVGRGYPAKYKKAICLFEQDMGVPLRRHYDTNFKGGYNFYGGMPGSAPILRTAATTCNYTIVVGCGRQLYRPRLQAPYIFEHRAGLEPGCARRQTKTQWRRFNEIRQIYLALFERKFTTGRPKLRSVLSSTSDPRDDLNLIKIDPN